MDDTFEARATAMAHHCARVATQAEEFEAQAVAADRQVRALKGAGKLDQAERYGAAEMARLHLAFVKLGAEYEGRAQALLGMTRQHDETLAAFMGRVDAKLAELGQQLGGLADLLEHAR